MDTVTHALLGVAVGASAGALAPQGTESLAVVGVCAAIAVLPDSPLFLYRKRQKVPPKAYVISHSLWPVILIWFLWEPIYAIAYLSHILIDIPTHNAAWAARLFYPFEWRFQCFSEWEWGNRSWWVGLFFTILIGAIWTMV